MPCVTQSCSCCSWHDYRCCCSCSISIEEIVTWIVVCSSIVLLYSTLKLCLLIATILLLVYCIYQRPDLVRWIQRLCQFGISMIKSILSLAQRTNPDPSGQEHSAEDTRIDLKEKGNRSDDPKMDRPSTSSVNLALSTLDQPENLSSDVSRSFSHTDEFVEVDTGDDFSIENRSLPLTRQVHANKNSSTSTAKNLCMETSSLVDRETSHPNHSTTPNQASKNVHFLPDMTIPNLDYNNSISQSGYYGPVHTVFALLDQPEEDERRKPSQLQSQVRVDDPVTERSDELSHPMDKRTREIRQAIASLQTDVLRPDAYSNRATGDPLAHLSIEDRTVLQLATENLVQAIVSTRADQKPTGQTIAEAQQIAAVENEKEHSRAQEVVQISKPTTTARTKLEYCTSSDTDCETADPSTQTRTKSLSDLQPPACLPVQASLFANSPMPRVPPKATVFSINDDDDDDDDELSHNNHTPAVKNVLISDDLFEDIPRRGEKILENSLFIKPDALAFNTEQTDWADYVSKRDIFSNTLRSDLPTIRSDDQHASLKQTIFSHFHRRPKLVNNHHHPATLQWTSLNATTTMNLIHPCALSTNGYDSISDQQSVTHRFLSRRTPLDFMWSQTYNHLKHGIFRVRKSRIIVAFDDAQRKSNADGDHQETLICTDRLDSSKAVHRASSELVIDSATPALNNNEPGTKVSPSESLQITDRSIASLIQSFDSAIRQGELSIHDEKQPNSTDNDDPCLSGSDSLYSVASEYVHC